jgi:hypothetical protein
MIAKDTNPKQITFDIYLHPFGSQMRNPVKLATQGIQDEYKQNNNTTQNALDMHK